MAQLAAAALAATGVAGTVALFVWLQPARCSVPRLASAATYFLSGTVAGLVAWKRAALGEGAPISEPTPRTVALAASSGGESDQGAAPSRRW